MAIKLSRGAVGENLKLLQKAVFPLHLFYTAGTNKTLNIQSSTDKFLRFIMQKVQEEDPLFELLLRAIESVMEFPYYSSSALPVGCMHNTIVRSHEL